MIVRQATGRVGVAGAVSPHWLRHAHAGHTRDDGAPIHFVQAALGHSSVATTSACLHARSRDSSARFLAPERLLKKPGAPALPLQDTGVMEVTTAKSAEQRRFKMSYTIDNEKQHQRLPPLRRPPLPPPQGRSRDSAPGKNWPNWPRLGPQSDWQLSGTACPALPR